MRRVQLLSQVLGGLVAAALIFVAARGAGFGRGHALAAVALLPFAVAGLLAMPAGRDAADSLLDARAENAPLTDAEAQLQPGVEVGVNVAFFAWVEERLPAGDSFHLVIGPAADEERVDGVGQRQAVILQWGLFQLAPHIAVEQSEKARDLAPGEGRNADWLVFYESDPADYRGAPLGAPAAYAPSFAIARSELAR
jgi:hypothetical protein